MIVEYCGDSDAEYWIVHDNALIRFKDVFRLENLEQEKKAEYNVEIRNSEFMNEISDIIFQGISCWECLPKIACIFISTMCLVT